MGPSGSRPETEGAALLLRPDRRSRIVPTDEEDDRTGENRDSMLNEARGGKMSSRRVGRDPSARTPAPTHTQATSGHCNRDGSRVMK